MTFTWVISLPPPASTDARKSGREVEKITGRRESNMRRPFLEADPCQVAHEGPPLCSWLRGRAHPGGCHLTSGALHPTSPPPLGGEKEKGDRAQGKMWKKVEWWARVSEMISEFGEFGLAPLAVSAASHFPGTTVKKLPCYLNSAAFSSDSKFFACLLFESSSSLLSFCSIPETIFMASCKRYTIDV